MNVLDADMVVEFHTVHLVIVQFSANVSTDMVVVHCTEHFSVTGGAVAIVKGCDCYSGHGSHATICSTREKRRMPTTGNGGEKAKGIINIINTTTTTILAREDFNYERAHSTHLAQQYLVKP